MVAPKIVWNCGTHLSRPPRRDTKHFQYDSMTYHMAHACSLTQKERYIAAVQVQVHSHSAPRSLLQYLPWRSVLVPISATNQPTNHPITTTGTFEPIFELTFTPRAGVLEDVVIYLGSGETGATSTGATGGGEWMYVPARRTLHWSLASSASTSGTSRSVSGPVRTTTLRDTFASNDAHPRERRRSRSRCRWASCLVL